MPSEKNKKIRAHIEGLCTVLSIHNLHEHPGPLLHEGRSHRTDRAECKTDCPQNVQTHGKTGG